MLYTSSASRLESWLLPYGQKVDTMAASWIGFGGKREGVGMDASRSASAKAKENTIVQINSVPRKEPCSPVTPRDLKPKQG